MVKLRAIHGLPWNNRNKNHIKIINNMYFCSNIKYKFNLSLPDQQQINNWNTQNHSVIFNLEQTPKLAGIDVAILGIGSSVSKNSEMNFTK